MIDRYLTATNYLKIGDIFILLPLKFSIFVFIVDILGLNPSREQLPGVWGPMTTLTPRPSVLLY